MIANPVARLRKVRDVSVMEINAGQYLVVACDSAGGIGNKPHDVVRVPEEVVGSFAVRVPLFELIACGAVPFLVCDCLSVEMDGSGQKIFDAIRAYARKAGVTEEVQFTGSTEENVPTVQTGVGVTVLGMADKNRFFPGASRAGDVVMCAGIPKSGPKHQIRMDDPEILSIEELMLLRNLPFIGDMLPAGSKGVLYEANQLASSASLQFVPDPGAGMDMHESAGPATCVLFSVSPDKADAAAAAITAPVQRIGYLRGE